MDQDTLDWLKANFFKTELELGHCLRTSPKVPASAISISSARSSSLPANTPRLRDRLQVEQRLIQDATERGWPREAERHTAISNRICELLTELGEPARPHAEEH